MNEPSATGELSIALALPPVSQQSTSEARQSFANAVRSTTSGWQFLLSGDVSVAVEWSVSEQTRYETDRSPDVDNILKPLLDALTGPSSALIDDNQVQHVSCHWVDSHLETENMRVVLRHSPSEWLRKEGLYFVQLDGGLCIPNSERAPDWFQRQIVDHYRQAIHFRDDSLTKGINYYIANVCMPSQRVFHRTRLGAYKVVKLEEFLARYAA